MKYICLYIFVNKIKSLSILIPIFYIFVLIFSSVWHIVIPQQVIPFVIIS